MWTKKLAVATTLLASAATPAVSGTVSIDGEISMGSSLGLIYNSKAEYTYSGATRNLAILGKACPVHMGETTRCKVRFKETRGQVTEIIAAKSGETAGVPVHKPGSVFDAFVCDSKDSVAFDQRPGCRHFDELMVQVIAMDKDVAKVVWNGQVKYAFSQRTLVNCKGTAISLASYIGRNFPPDLKGC